MVVLVPIGSLLVEENRTEADWIELVAKAKKQVIEVMEGRLGLTGLKDMIVWEEVNTPVSCKLNSLRWWLSADPDSRVWLSGRDKFNLTHGSILGISHDFFNVLAFRELWSRYICLFAVY
jgi:phytoene desaturase (3,4-didehydrolycopene-forming)